MTDTTEVAQASGAEPVRGQEPPAAGTAQPSPAGIPRFLRWLTEANAFMVTACALLAGLFVGAVLICVTTPAVLQAWGHIGSHPGHAFGQTWTTVAGAYSALLEGSIINPSILSHAISTGHGWFSAPPGQTPVFAPLSETLVAATPLILAGTGVAMGFATGVFNIGGQGQFICGALAALYVGFQFRLPIGIHLPLVILAGAAGGAVAGFIPGILKARTGAHEVITTIMLNYIVIDLVGWLLTGPPFQQPGQSNTVSKSLPTTAQMPHLFGSGLRVNLSFLFALAMAGLASWLMGRSRLGFAFRVSGLNPDAARTAGIDARRITVLALVISGAFVGMAGMATLSGTDFFMTSTPFGGETGFNAITVALLGRNKPGGVVLGSLLFAALISGGRNMQAVTGIPIDLTTVIQAIIVFFVATPALVREVFRLREAKGGSVRIATKGWAA
jgi:simple sugar transport system permease protein